jgi:EAL domain-containing protein (putative c-di-GMP-specific phosphodiesterase class I)/GGDEF domain-containing protein
VSDNPARFLGFAFASADLLFEVQPDGSIGYVLGAVQKVMGMDPAKAAGRPWRELIAESDHELVAVLIDGLGPADRRGPIKVELARQGGRDLRRFAGLSACRLPQNAPAISCVLTLAPNIGEPEEPPAEGAHGLYDRDGFMKAARRLLDGARSAGLDLNVELVELKGLGEHVKSVDDGTAEAALRRISAAIRAESFRGQGAARLGDEQFAVVRAKADGPDQLTSRLGQAASAAGATVQVNASSLPMSPECASLHTLRALRYALDSFLKDGAGGARAAFQTVLENTVLQANAFTAQVQSRKFQLVYQPVVELGSAELQHFEALVRLDGDKSPAKAIRMAEELELIQELDLAVVDQVARKLCAKGQPRLKLAANISARSMMAPGFLHALLKLVTAEPLGERLMFEVTETAELQDLDQANGAIQRLRSQGFKVFLDDFGAGAASMACLKALAVDGVKVDGRYVKSLGASERDDALMRHLVELCQELSVDTIAEQVETQAEAEVLARFGVRCGQGWHFGRPAPEPNYQPPSAMRARRVGEVTSWS